MLINILSSLLIKVSSTIIVTSKSFAKGFATKPLTAIKVSSTTTILSICEVKNLEISYNITIKQS